MWYRTVHLLAGSLLCLALGACNRELIAEDEGPTPTFYIGGKVTGATGPFALQNSNGTNLIVAEDGVFTFGTPMVSSALYNVTIAVPPNSQACKVTNGSGTVGSADISNVNVICTPITYMLGSR
jgi:hypothetical protein